VGTVSRGSERTLVALMDGTEAQAEGVFAFVRRHFNTQGTKLVFLLVSTPLDRECLRPPPSLSPESEKLGRLD